MSPVVSVVVPTRDRRGFLPELVDCLRAQTLSDFEVLLVDDGSVDDTQAVAAAAFGDDPRFRLVAAAGEGPARARNLGAAAATAPWIAFTDDDCLPEPDWLRGLVAAAERSGATVVQGRTRPDDRVPWKDLPWFSRSLSIATWSGRYQTCNLLVDAATFRTIDGFDESFPRPVGEDTDLGLRLEAAGAVTAFDPDAVVVHRMLPMTYWSFLKRRAFWAHVVQLVALNPRGRSVFPHPYVAYRDHALVWVGLPLAAVAVAAGWWWLPLLGAVGLGARRSRRMRYKQRSRLVSTAWCTAELVGDVVSTVAFAVQSVRYRTVLL